MGKQELFEKLVFSPPQKKLFGIFWGGLNYVKNQLADPYQNVRDYSLKPYAKKNLMDFEIELIALL